MLSKGVGCCARLLSRIEEVIPSRSVCGYGLAKRCIRTLCSPPRAVILHPPGLSYRLELVAKDLI